MRRYRVIGLLLVVLASAGAFIGGLWLTAAMLRQSSQAPLTVQEKNFAPVVIQTCQDNMLRIDCQCFWEHSKDAYTDINLMPLMMALEERKQWGPAITRGRMEKVAGAEATRLIGWALYDCVKM